MIDNNIIRAVRIMLESYEPLLVAELLDLDINTVFEIAEIIKYNKELVIRLRK